MRLVFAGTPDFAVPTLNALADSEHTIAGVLTQPDRPAGRGRKLHAPPVKQRAVELNLPIQQPPSLKDDDAHDALAALAPEVIVVVAYGLILPQQVLDLPRYGCTNLHPSLLPRWRGAAPIARAVLAGDEQTGVSIMQVDSGLDSGPVYLSRSTAIGAQATTEQMHDALAEQGASAMLEVVDALPGGLTPTPQDEAGVTYAERLSKQEARIDWTLDAQAIARAVRGYTPWPVAHTQLDGQAVRIWQAQAVEQTNDASPGTVVSATSDGIDVAAGDGLLRITELQLPGKKRMGAASAVNGRQWQGLCFE